MLKKGKPSKKTKAAGKKLRGMRELMKKKKK